MKSPELTDLYFMDNRNEVLNLLENYHTEDSTESSMLSDMIRFVKSNPDCFKRELLIGHITGSAWIIDQSRKYVLLIHHRKLNRWFQPGGHCDGDSDVQRVAWKEATEETGLSDIRLLKNEVFDIDIHAIPERKGVPTHLHYDIRFLFEADKTTELVINEESNDLKWVPINEVEKYNNEESILRMAKKMF